MAVGRPPKYKKEYAKAAEKLCRLSATDWEIADFLEVDVRTIYRWKNEHEEFCQALKVGKGEFDERVKRSLAMRAIGYEHPDVDIRVIEGEIVITELTKHYPPDTTAALAWLHNRDPENWRPRKAVGDEDGEDTSLSEAVNKLIDKLPS